MAYGGPFWTSRFGGCYHRAVPQEDAGLPLGGPNSRCGEYMRRFWQPVCFSDELRDLPLRVRMLAEDLVAFRDQRGAVGLLYLHCPHRVSSLVFGLVGAKWIRCCYLGLLFIVTSELLDT